MEQKLRISAPLTILLIIGLAIAQCSWAIEQQATPIKNDNSRSLTDLDVIDQWRNSLTEERQILERQADRQYDGVLSLAHSVLWIFGLIGTVSLGFLVWFFGKSRGEFKKTINEAFEKQAKEIVEKEAEQLRQRYESLKHEVEDLSAYKRRQVVWVAKAAKYNNDVSSPEIVSKALYAIGIQHISFVTPKTGDDFELGDPDLVILSFDGSEEARRILSILVQRLKRESPPVPLLIYTFSPGGDQVCLEQEDMSILDEYYWYVPVNFPVQLLAQAQLLIRRSRSLLGGDIHGEL